ncbi:MAG: hypothetical protein L0Y57_03420, partial [Beijerinckiaceae bacterium]|nr:hypothetical protein [Beijerinckiaceae bacterium]
NIPLFLAGAIGLTSCLIMKPEGAARSWAAVFLCAVLTAFGSAYYHWSPSNESLVWDRLPMAAGFMALFIAVTSEHLGTQFEKLGLAMAIAAGASSVLWWAIFDDLRFYGWIQFFPLVTICAIIIFYPGAYSHRHYLAFGLGLYLLAKFAEHYDGAIFAMTGGALAGHPLKHLLAAAAVLSICLMLRNRRRLAP